MRALAQRLIEVEISVGPEVIGRFGAQMVVSLHNDGPVTFLLESF